MWKDNDKIMEIYSNVKINKIQFPCLCPLCSKQSGHIYIHKHSEKSCGIWTWCSECKAFSHMSDNTPKWWNNPNFVDDEKLCSEPEYLETIVNKIDAWVNTLMPSASTKPNKPFVMEKSFEVILKENIEEFSAGTRGTIVIKDDFKTLSISFIDSKGKRKEINVLPEKLISMVEVIEN